MTNLPDCDLAKAIVAALDRRDVRLRRGRSVRRLVFVLLAFAGIWGCTEAFRINGENRAPRQRTALLATP